MSLLSVVQDVCTVVGVTVPSSVFSNINNNRTMTEMLALANEMAQRIAYDTRDWTLLKSTATLVGDGVKTSFPLPTDFKRMLLTTNMWRSTNTMFPMRFIPDADQWAQRRAMNIYDPYGEWTILGGNILVMPVMGIGVTATFAYLVKNCVMLNPGATPSDKFLSDADNFRLDERVFKLGMIWQWKAQKGSPYQEDMGTYGDALMNVMGHDSPAPILVGRMGISFAARTAYPFPVPTPGSP